MTNDKQFTREAQVERLHGESLPWDIAVIGGGASGMGVAVDAAARGYRVALLEQHDFGKGTSSRSTKLIHGGLRYLKQGRIRLVHDALVERGILRRNAAHLVHPLPTIVPVYSRWERMYYGVGVKVYERLSGRYSLGASHGLSLSETLAAIPTLDQSNGLRGGVCYLDGIFDDTRLLVNLMQTAIEYGAVCANYVRVRELVKENGRVAGVVAEDIESGRTLRVAARVVVNATGAFTDHILKMDNGSAPAAIAPSQGIHLSFDRKFLPGDSAMIIPKTRDGRVVFAVPWHDHAVVGTTDTPRPDAPLEPRPLPGEVDFLLETIGQYLSPRPQQADIRAIFAGIRPLVRAGDSSNTSQLGRDHEVRISPTGLVSLLGGKWTTYRKMAEDCVDRAAEVGGLATHPSTTKTLSIHGNVLCAGLPTPHRAPTEGLQSRPAWRPSVTTPAGSGDPRRAGGAGSGDPRPARSAESEFREYGADAPAVARLSAELPGGSEQLAERLPYVGGQVVYAARYEMARTIEDVLARRTRALFLDAEAAIAAAPRVGKLLAAELGRDAQWQDREMFQFREVAEGYRASGKTVGGEAFGKLSRADASAR